MALPGRVPDGRICDRLGDEVPGREFPACGRAASGESSFFSRTRSVLSVKEPRSTVKLEAPFKPSVDDRSALKQVVDYYHEVLKQSPEALKYLQKRSLDHPEMIDRFRLGFSNRTLGYRLPERNRREGAEIRGRLQRLGILRESGHEHFTGSVVIPVFDLEGNVTEVYGRKITEGLRAGTPLHTYLVRTAPGRLERRSALTVSKEIILCESLIDALSFWSADYRNVTASYGVNGFTDDHREAFKKHGIKKVLIAYDRDEAGEKAAHALAEELISMGIDCYRVLFPKGMDANEYACKVKPGVKEPGSTAEQGPVAGKRQSAFGCRYGSRLRLKRTQRNRNISGS